MKRTYKKVSIVVVVGIILVAAIFIISIREDNGAVRGKVEKTGNNIQWDGESFTYEGNTYFSAAEIFLDDCFYLNPDYAHDKNAIFNLRTKESLWNRMLNNVGESNGYWSQSATGVSLIYVDADNMFYAQKEDIPKLQQYYGDGSNYSWIICEENVESDKSVETVLDLSAEEIDVLWNMKESMATEELKDDSEQSDYMYRISQDHVFRSGIEVRQVENDWYWIAVPSDREGYSLVYQLPDSISEKLTKAVDSQGDGSLG